MPEFPDITVVLIHYRRLDELKKCIESLRKYLKYPEEKLTWIVVDDSGDSQYGELFKSIKKYSTIEWIETPKNGGFGATFNYANRLVKTEYTLFIESDYILTKALDLRIGAALLETRKNIGMLRYRGTAGGHIVSHQFESNVSDYLPDYQDGVGLPGKLTYLQLDSGSPDLYLWSNGPHLRHKSFTDFYGAYPEGQKLGIAEEAYAHQVRDGMKVFGAPALAILPEWILMHWQHIGDSFQNTEFDLEHKFSFSRTE